MKIGFQMWIWETGRKSTLPSNDHEDTLSYANIQPWDQRAARNRPPLMVWSKIHTSCRKGGRERNCVFKVSPSLLNLNTVFVVILNAGRAAGWPRLSQIIVLYIAFCESPFSSRSTDPCSIGAEDFRSLQRTSIRESDRSLTPNEKSISCKQLTAWALYPPLGIEWNTLWWFFHFGRRDWLLVLVFPNYGFPLLKDKYWMCQGCLHNQEASEKT